MKHTRNPTRNHNPNPYPYKLDLPGEGAISEALPTPVTPRPRTVLGSLLPVLLGDPRDEGTLGTDNSALSHPLMHCPWGWGTVASVGGNAASSLEAGITAIYVFAAVIGVNEVVSAVCKMLQPAFAQARFADVDGGMMTAVLRERVDPSLSSFTFRLMQ